MDTRNNSDEKLAMEITLLGKDFPLPSMPIVKTLNKHLAIGISSGHVDCNEDAADIINLGNRYILSVADGSWADGARRLAITEIIGSFEQYCNDPIGWMYALDERINHALILQILQEGYQPVSENAFIITHIIPGECGSARVHWVSHGNAFLYLCNTNAKAMRLNNVQPMWLDPWSKLIEVPPDDWIAEPYSAHTHMDKWPNFPRELEVGTLKLDSGDTLVLATDGLPQCQQRDTVTLYPAEIQSIIGKRAHLESKCQALIEAALTLGGMDNIACAVYQHS